MVLLEDLISCQLHKWYPNFTQHTIPTLFHSLPKSYLSYLQGLSENGSHSPPPFLLPKSGSVFPDFNSKIPDSDSGFPNSDSESETEVEVPTFPDLELEIQESISSLGGKVVPKLNWSVPKDATWISPIGSLKCESFSEISLLLHSSDCVIHDLTEALTSCDDFGNLDKSESEFEFFLGLRKWIPGLRPESEFRCFVKNKDLIAISQREVTAFYPSLLTQKDQIVNSISDFFEEIIKPKFDLKNYTFDVYLTKKGRVVLVDFNPWGGFTLPLLFDWDEFEKNEKENENEKENVNGNGNGEIELRIVENYLGVRPGIKTAVPYDYLDTSQGSGWDQFFRNAEVEIRRQMKLED
ncbi:hypothetical protein LUZ60_009836 [Juncus effusus]|nr:hypothetical protein LUZ60_009836 [Juncus effusus]